MKFKEVTLLVLLDGFRYDYVDPEDTPFLYSMLGKGVYAKKLYNPGGYCERTPFMTGAGPEITDNYFAMALMPIGYKRPEYEPMFKVPPFIRVRMAMTEDQKLDFEKDSFKNYTTGETIESFWDVMRAESKKWGIEACVALGVRSWKGRTTHGSRPVQLMDKLKQGIDLAYIQYSEIDQQLHYLGTSKEVRGGVLKNADGSVENLYNFAKKHYEKVNLLIFGDHGMGDVKEYIDLALEYPPFQEGWDYLYLKNSGAVQFWIFNPKVEKYIKNDPILKKYGFFKPSPTSRQADLIWQANHGVLVSPCHFHAKHEAVKGMHGWAPENEDQKGMALVVDEKHKGIKEEADLRDICNTICDLVGIRYPKQSEGVSLIV